MNAAVYCLLAVALVGCTGTPVTPDPIAPTVMVRTETIEVPVAAPREAPPELTAPMWLEMPELFDTGKGYYGLHRDGAMRLLRMVSAVRSYYRICSGYAGGAE